MAGTGPTWKEGLLANDNTVTTGKSPAMGPAARADVLPPASVAPTSESTIAPGRTPGSLWVTVGETVARPTTGAVKASGRTHERYRVSVQDYGTFREQGFLIVRGLVGLDDVAELAGHVDDLIYDRI